jgi:capsular polysaccharide biosynthesis protein
VLLRHYGHFLLESMSRLWAIKAFPELPVAWQFFRKLRRPTGWQLEVMELLGIADRPMILVPRPMRFSTLIVPDAGARLDSFLHPQQVASLATFPFRDPRKGKRIWLSRRQLSEVRGRVLEEGAIEDRLAERGWMVISPELLSVRQQLETMADAEILGGFIGSAFHTLLLARDIRAKVRMLRRYRRDIPVIFDGIAKAKGFDQRLIDVRLEKLNADKIDALSVNRMEDPAEMDRIVEELNT